MDILFVTATRIGDAVLSTGLLGYLIERYPGARLTIAAGPVAAPIFEAVPGLERVIVVTKKRASGHWLSLWNAVVARRWDIVVDLRGSALAWLLFARHRKVMAKGAPNEHRVRQLARLFDLDPPPSPRVWVSVERERQAELLVPPGLPVLAVGPVANWRGKQWAVGQFAELVQRLTTADGLFPSARVAVSAAEHERSEATRLFTAIPPGRLIDIIGVDIATTAAIFRRCAFYIGNDSGLMHVAAASGVPTLGLFGPSAIEQYAPWGPHTGTAHTEATRETLLGGNFDHRTTDTLMDTLSVDAAEAAARKLWRRLTSDAA